MSRRADDASAETFWPGYVDAVTNLVLNLLFVVVIMTVAVFMFALELGRRQPKVQPQVTEPAAMASPTPQTPTKNSPEPTEQALRSQLASLKEQVETLKTKEAQIQALQSKLTSLEAESKQHAKTARQGAEQKTGEAQPASQDGHKAVGEGAQTTPSAGASGGTSNEPPKVVNATAAPRTPERGLEKAVAGAAMGGIIVKFADDAIALTRSEADELRNTLAPILAAGGAKIEVVVPTGFTEAKRLGFYRVMAVRNHLIALKMPANRIEVSVREGSNGSDSSRVMVSPR